MSRRGFLRCAAAVSALMVGGVGAKVRGNHHTGALATRCRFGAYANNTPYPEQPLFDLESLVGHKLAISSWFVGWGSPWVDSAARALQTKGRYDILCCWEAHGVKFEDILSGAKDDEIRSFVKAASAYTAGTVIIRLFHEFNGDWYDWTDKSGKQYCTSAAQWKQAYRHVVTVARAEHSRVKFMFCANAPLTQADFDKYYPGDAYCDIIGADSYGGSGFTGSTSVDVGFKSTYDILAAGSRKPVWVGETGYRGSDIGAAQYARSWYTSQKYPRLAGLVWFENSDFPFGPLQVAEHKAYLL